MTMNHIARSFKVSLWIEHPDIDPDFISNTIHLTPVRTTRAGAPRSTPIGEPLEGTYECSRWGHNFNVEGASELGAVLEDLAEELQIHEPFFRRLVQEGGSVELFCGVFAAGNWDEVLPHPLLGKLASLHLDLRLDVYPKGDQSA